MSALARAFTGPAVTAGMLEQPLAYFPLTPSQLGSITLPAYEPVAVSGIGSHASVLFGETISCSEVSQAAWTEISIFANEYIPWSRSMQSHVHGRMQ